MNIIFHNKMGKKVKLILPQMKCTECGHEWTLKKPVTREMSRGLSSIYQASAVGD